MVGKIFGSFSVFLAKFHYNHLVTLIVRSQGGVANKFKKKIIRKTFLSSKGSSSELKFSKGNSSIGKVREAKIMWNVSVKINRLSRIILSLFSDVLYGKLFCTQINWLDQWLIMIDITDVLISVNSPSFKPCFGFCYLV